MVIRFDRITTDPNVMSGLPCVRDLGIPVSHILALLAAHQDERAILAAHPDLEPEDLRQALEYAALAVDRPAAASNPRATGLNEERQRRLDAAIEFLTDFRKAHPLRGLRIEDMIREGRRY